MDQNKEVVEQSVSSVVTDKVKSKNQDKEDIPEYQIQFGLATQIKYVDTKNQLADLLTKGSFARDEWDHLLRL